ncbi:tryptophan halogenase family protein [Gilvimarinus sp. DA14]|uniref:tryptophan halogenase family protein n=1 Tax=Gilvimarinus sp. DA14 TaxID=2956798 RepID=UPI0020B6B9A1|nr:tryptophan halogenase family protein [Gilvimarinus sp. DA14]UTF60303.1 tryptophan 7-halogenase [Gilvimarinus sp. DA14]
MTAPVRKVVIAGGGTAGWVTAAALSRQLGDMLDITLVESDAIATVGVGEASIPTMPTFHRLLRIDEQEFMRASNATFKLGISFENWRSLGHKYVHSFGETGKDTWVADFHHFWLRARELGFGGEFGDYCLELQAALENKFALPQGATSGLNYAYHLDAGLYATFLRRISESAGVYRVEGKIDRVVQDADSGYINSLQLEDGREISGDLFIDCTGFRALLIEQTLQSGFEDWSHWLPCNRALAVQSKSHACVPYTRSIARSAGWQWQIPLQNRVGNGLVYAADYLTDAEAEAELMNGLEGDALTAPRLIRYQTGRRKQAWSKNCIAFGLSSGFVEPLESTSIHLVMIGVTRLLQLFPFDGISDALIARFNQLADAELEGIRDFIILHYHVTQRDDTPFWRYCRDMSLPDSLSQRIQLFRDHAQAYQGDSELFRVDSWVQVMLGQGVEPAHYHPMAKAMKPEQLQQFLQQLRGAIAQSVGALPSHEAFLKQYCPAQV